jgi:hypothetical protein
MYEREGSYLAIRNQYRIEPIDYHTAMKIVVENHYLHRKASCSYAFGLFRRSDSELMGVITYGSPVSSTLCKGIAGEEYRKEVIELTRLWIDDSVGRNAESFLIGNTIKEVPKKIIVSFADPTEGHAGYVYQATNWIYTGLSKKRPRWKIKDDDSKHNHRAITQKYTNKEIREKFSDIMEYVEAVRKHRYIYINASKSERKEIKRKLKYPVLDYPKLDKSIS